MRQMYLLLAVGGWVATAIVLPMVWWKVRRKRPFGSGAGGSAAVYNSPDGRR